MVEYAERECGDCLGVFPANELKRKTVSRLTGSSVRGVDLRVEGDLLNPARNRSYYREVEIFLCSECRRSRRFKAIKNFIGCLTLLSIAAAAGLAALVWWGSRPPSGNNVPSQQVDAEPANRAEYTTPDRDFQVDSSVAFVEPIQNQDVPVEADSDEVVRSAPISQAVEGPQTIPMGRLESYVLEAVTTGKALRWSLDRESGYVVPSEANEVGCRDYYFTDDNRPEWRSATQRHCPVD